MKLKKYGNKVGMEETQYNYPTSIALNTHVLILTSQLATQVTFNTERIDNFWY